MNFTLSEENYLKAIFHLQKENEVVNTSALAEKLQTRPASVTDMMKKLHAKKLLHYKPYYGFSLSTEGKKIALTVVRRHRLWEYFLSEKLKFGWDEVHEIAEELEHVGHKKLIDKLDEYLGYPQFDPHGDPIPNGKGKMQQQEVKPLSQVPLNQAVTLSSVTNQSKELLEELALRNIQIGTRMEIKRRSKFDGSLEVKLPGGQITLAGQLANHLMVKKGTAHK